MLMRQQAGDQYPRWTPKLQEIVFDTVGIRDVISLADSGAGGSGSGRIPAAQAETTITTVRPIFTLSPFFSRWAL